MEQEKKLIRNEIEELCKKQSQNKVASMAGTSPATISQIRNNNWSKIKDQMWRKIKTNLRIETTWKTAETHNLLTLTQLLSAAQSRSMAIAVSHEAGTGKSHSYKYYARRHNNIIYIECKNYWSKKSYARNLLKAVGIDGGGTTEELIGRFLQYVSGLKNPLIIFDQIDKLKDSRMDLFMDFYNDMEGSCGFILSGVPALKKRILRGVQHDKIGYREIYSRIGRRFISLDKITYKDVKKVCIVNGLEDTDEIRKIYNLCDGDLRRVRRRIDRYFLIQEEQRKNVA